MIEFIDDLEKDIKRCEDTLKENDFLEVVIVIEELHNKYKNEIKEVSKIEKDVVWKYSKKDLQIIEYCLKEYKEELIKEYKEKNIDTKINDFKYKIKNSKTLNQEQVLVTIESIESIKNEDIILDEKWNKLKQYLDFIQSQERYIGREFLDIISLIVK